MKFTPTLLLFLFIGCNTFEPAGERIHVNLNAPHLPVGTVEAVFDSFSRTGTRTGEIQVSYFPDNNVVCLEFRHELFSYYQFWTETNRQAFVSALERYKLDFEQRNLSRSNNRTRRAYGSVNAYVIWRMSRISGQGFSYPGIDIGYQFKNNAPYFSIIMRQASNESNYTKDTLFSNSNINIYFTRALADELAALFDEGFLRSLRVERPGASRRDSEVAGEEY